MEKKILNLSLSKEWYEKIADDTKNEEYREIKLYWANRLLDIDNNLMDVIKSFKEWKSVKSDKLPNLICGGLKLRVFSFKPFTHVRFTNGYPKGGEPYIEKEIVSISIGKPKKGLCPDRWLDKEFFIIKFK